MFVGLTSHPRFDNYGQSVIVKDPFDCEGYDCNNLLLHSDLSLYTYQPQYMTGHVRSFTNATGFNCSHMIPFANDSSVEESDCQDPKPFVCLYECSTAPSGCIVPQGYYQYEDKYYRPNLEIVH